MLQDRYIVAMLQTVVNENSPQCSELVITAAQCRMARAALELGVRELAALAQVSTNTITRLERGEGLYPRTVEAIQRALETAGIEFLDGDGVRLRPKAGR